MVGEHGYEMALTLEDRLDDLGNLMNSPRFLVASRPDGERFANSMVAMQAKAPMRMLRVDLDNVYDPDPGPTGAQPRRVGSAPVDMG